MYNFYQKLSLNRNNTFLLYYLNILSSSKLVQISVSDMRTWAYKLVAYMTTKSLIPAVYEGILSKKFSITPSFVELPEADVTCKENDCSIIEDMGKFIKISN